MRGGLSLRWDVRSLGVFPVPLCWVQSLRSRKDASHQIQKPTRFYCSYNFGYGERPTSNSPFNVASQPTPRPTTSQNQRVRSLKVKNTEPTSAAARVNKHPSALFPSRAPLQPQQTRIAQMRLLRAACTAVMLMPCLIAASLFQL